MIKRVKARLPIININLEEPGFLQKFNTFCKYYRIYLITANIESNKYFCNFNKSYLHSFDDYQPYTPMDIYHGILKIEYKNVYGEDRIITIRNGDIVCFTGIDISILSLEYINENEKILSNE